MTAKIKRGLGWDLEPQLVAEFDGKPVLIAQNISFQPRTNSNSTSSSTAPNTSNLLRKRVEDGDAIVPPYLVKSE